jgi:hypothetical protein
VIAWAVCVGDAAKFASCALPGLRRTMAPDDVLAELTADRGSIGAAYDEALAHFAGTPGLEALVLLHEDVELLGADAGDRLRAALGQDPAIAVAGAVGSLGAPGLAWWEGEVRGRASEPRGTVAGPFDPPDVDVLDGLLLALSPWAVEHLRFGDDPGFHGYDAHVCCAARAAGRRVVVADLPLFHHTKGGFGDPAAFAAADARHRARWGALPSGAWTPSSAAASSTR